VSTYVFLFKNLCININVNDILKNSTHILTLLKYNIIMKVHHLREVLYAES
jgi:hypothetical protein